MNPFYTLINRSDMAEETVLFRGYINKILKNEKAKRKKTLKNKKQKQNRYIRNMGHLHIVAYA